VIVKFFRSFVFKKTYPDHFLVYRNALIGQKIGEQESDSCFYRIFVPPTSTRNHTQPLKSLRESRTLLKSLNEFEEIENNYSSIILIVHFQELAEIRFLFYPFY
jgi:hypothetical protein